MNLKKYFGRFEKGLLLLWLATGIALPANLPALAQSGDELQASWIQSPVESPEAEATIIPVPDETGTQVPVTTPQEPHVAQPQLYINPAGAQIYLGATDTTQVHISESVGLSTVEFQIKFNPWIIGVVDAAPETAGVQIEINPELSVQGAVISRNQVDNSTGIIEFGIFGLDPESTIDNLALITWLGFNEGTTELVMKETTLTDSNGQPISHTTLNSSIKVVAVQENPITGQVLLQGRLQHNGVDLFFTEQRCDELTQDNWQNDLEPTVSTDTEGYFQVVADEGQQFKCLQIIKQGYLRGQKELPDGVLGSITLVGGDVTGDNIINIFDLAYLGTNYGDNNPQIDINGDGTVNIFDLVLAASNYGQQGPVTEWK